MAFAGSEGQSAPLPTDDFAVEAEREESMAQAAWPASGSVARLELTRP
jgi:hypothetical protein